MKAQASAIASTANPTLELGLQYRLRRRAEAGGGMGELEAIALRLGMVQGTLKPRFRQPQLVVFAADHGLAVEGLEAPGARTTAEQISHLLADRLPLAVLARANGLELKVLDCGVSQAVAPHPRLICNKVAHGSRSARLGPALSADQAQAALRIGMDLADSLPGNALLCAGLGAGGLESAAMVIAHLGGLDVRPLVTSGPGMNQDQLARLMVLLHTALDRHRALSNPIDVLAALGGFDIAAMVGAILVASSRRHLVVVDGMPAYAARLVATRIAPDVRPYCICCHSHAHQGLQQVRALLESGPMLELGLDSIDGTGAALAWPLIASAAALLSDVVHGDGQAAQAAAPL